MDLEKQAIEILQAFATEDKYLVGDSGGKDSAALRCITEKARVPFEIVNNHTTVDAPETVYYIRKMQAEYLKRGINYIIAKPKETMFQLIVKHKFPPTRLMRYCCAELKESYGIGRKVVTGVRKAESRNRAENQGIVTFTKPNKEVKESIDTENFHLTARGGVVVHNIDNDESRRVVENCYRTSKTLINPLIDWDDEFLWWYIRKNNLIINPLYEQGFCRVGCIGCPMGGKNRWREFELYPKYKQYYINAFKQMLIAREQSGLENKMGWKDADSVFRWWMEDKNINGQYEMVFDEQSFSNYKEI